MAGKTFLFRSQAALSSGMLKDLVWQEEALVLGEDCYSGQYWSAETPAPPFDRLAPSWNAALPTGTAVQLFARVQVGECWSAWLDCGSWSPDGRRAGKVTADALAKVHGGAVRLLQGKATAFQLRAVLHANDTGESPRLYLVSASLHTPDAADDDGVPLYRRCIPVPAYARAGRDPLVAQQADCALCAVMLMNRWGEDLLPEEAVYACLNEARSAVDPGYVPAYTGCFGYECYFAYPDIAGLKHEIKNGCACAVRLEGPEGSRWAVVRGFDTDAEGGEQVLVNDPAAPTDGEAEQTVPLERFRGQWTGKALLLHQTDRTRSDPGPERVAGELRPAELPGEYLVYVRGERKSLPALPGALCARCTAPDGCAYATTAHKHFCALPISETGSLTVDAAAFSPGTRLTVYLIGGGSTVVAQLTV